MIRKIYFMGIKGVGMASLAVIAKQAGFIVAGSDVATEYITDKVLKDEGIEVLEGFKADNIKEFVATSPKSEVMIVITGAHGGFDNEEAKYAGSIGIKTITHGEAVGLFMNGSLFDRSYDGISIAGSHGKTTVSAMIATYLSKLNLDPTYAVGTSEILPIGAAGHFGQGKYFVAEADEYMAAPTNPTAKFLYQYPKYLIINNIDFDHPDFYKDLAAVKNAYGQFIDNLASDGVLIVNGDDENIKDLLAKNPDKRVIKYGTGSQNDFIISNFTEDALKSHFSVTHAGTLIGRFTLSVPGYHNAKNVLAAIALLVEIGVSIVNIEKVLPEFAGSKRRLEILGETEKGVTIIDDYAHHPEEIRKTLEALKLAYPDKKITVVFQAHTFGRTKALESEFVSAFAPIHELIILPTFASARAEVEENLAEDRAFVEKVRAVNPNVKLIENEADVIEYLSLNVASTSIILTMGAGNVYKVGLKLINKN